MVVCIIISQLLHLGMCKILFCSPPFLYLLKYSVKVFLKLFCFVFSLKTLKLWYLSVRGVNLRVFFPLGVSFNILG